MVGSIDPRCETVRGTHWPNKVAWLFGARVAETILASGPKSPHQQAGHMDASDPIRPSKKLLWHGGRPHMGPCFRRDDTEFVALPRTQNAGATKIPPRRCIQRKTYAALKPAIALTSRYSSRPYLPHSRPLPDCL